MIIVFLALSVVMTKTTAAPQAFSCTGVTQISQGECAALVALYNSTTGAHWQNHSNWLVTNTPSNWFGVTVSGGHVASLSLGTNILNGSIPPELGNLTGLTYLDLDWNALSGSIPSQLSSLANLTYLDLHYNQLSGSIPPGLGGLANLTVLSLSYNQLTGSIPSQLASLAHLTDLNLASNQLSGSIPPVLGNLTKLISLYLEYNQLSGSIPPELASLVNLTSLSLSKNQLSGVIPPELGNLANLASLGLWSNQLSGAIPPELGSLTNLTSLLLDSNQLSGAIPPVLGSLTKLTSLRLDSNDLSGAIPHELGNLANLTLLWLDSNGLSGAIPPELVNLTNLYSLGLKYNWLTIPDPYPSDPPTLLDIFLLDHASGWETTQGVVAQIPVSGGQIQSRDGRVLVTVPSRGVSQPVTLVLTSLVQPGHATGKLVFANTSFKLAAYDSGGMQITPFNFVQPVIVTLSYQDNDVAGQDESQLILYYWDASTSSWKDAAQTCVPPSIYQRNLANNTLSVQVCHLTEFALMVFNPPEHKIYLPSVLK